MSTLNMKNGLDFRLETRDSKPKTRDSEHVTWSMKKKFTHIKKSPSCILTMTIFFTTNYKVG